MSKHSRRIINAALKAWAGKGRANAPERFNPAARWAPRTNPLYWGDEEPKRHVWTAEDFDRHQKRTRYKLTWG